MYYNITKFKGIDIYIYYSDDGLLSISRGHDSKFSSAMIERSSKYSQDLEEYFSGNKQAFNYQLVSEGTPFQKSVWNILNTIPYGEIWTYKMVAEKLGDTKKVRAVANAIGKNPIMIVTPCHRVIGTDGTLHGFGGGIDLKEHLIELERGKPNEFKR